MSSPLSAEAGRRDILRQIVVISATVFMILAAMVGTGLFGGTPVQDLQNGALDADGSYLAPGRSAFSIWSVIYLLMIGYAIWQALPAQRAVERQRLLGWRIAATAVLNGAWLLVAQFLDLALTVVTIAALVAVLGITFHKAVVSPGRGVFSALLIDGTVGLHLGWVTVATVVNIAAWLTAIGDPAWESAATAWSIAMLVAVVVIGLSITAFGRWRIAPALAMTWGLVWIAVQRFTGEPSDAAVGAAALVAGILILAPAAIGRVLKVLRPSGD